MGSAGSSATGSPTTRGRLADEEPAAQPPSSPPASLPAGTDVPPASLTSSPPPDGEDDGPVEADPDDSGRLRFGTLAVVLAVVVGLLFGYAGGWLMPRLTKPADDSVEAGFTRDMIFHHAQAVEMGFIGFQRASDRDVRQQAVDIAATQQGEIGMMHAWLAEWGLDPTGSGPAMAWMPEGMRDLGSDGLMPGMANAQEMTRLREARGKDLDVLFLQLMIRHHLGGVHMIDAVLAAGGRSEVIRAAKTMKNVQRTELANLNQLLTNVGGSPLPAD
jgi:uncharacterized protein (DUF305 family)